MTRRTAGAAVAAAVLCAALVTGCGGGSDSSGTSSGATPSATDPAPSSSELAELNRLVDDAESAASAAEADADKNG
ncbi:hypothetical protein HUT19_19470 [Streptomyces sp. NA02950]|uniref:hypothetical protein n=1 Tax=Streptomyces sp. NA02950 TaxID=2742137 RepID=UPI001590DDA9|nr:hypothetical protein [Streptomyces sp. NA02950]QKV93667.1 hypothetical protein HUT19_19470 [Streptomyces sp. NA02950]